MLKILHVFSTFNIGGTEVRTADLINKLGSEFQHTIRILKTGKEAANLICNNSNVKIIEGKFPLSTVKAVLTAKKETELLQPNLIITYSWGAIEWVICHALFNQTPLLHIEDGFTDETPDSQKLLRITFRRLFFRFSTKLIVPAIVLKKVAQKKWFIPEKKIEFIPNGVDTDRFQPAISSSTTECVILGIIGSLYPVKNHQRLFRIISQIPSHINFKLQVIGTGADESFLKKTVTDLSLENRVTFLGLRRDIDVLLKNMDIFCLSSDHEQMPITVLEAMATGLPIISTDVGDIAEMVADENREFIISVDQDDLYLKKLVELIQYSSIRKKIGEANRKKCCANYSNQLMYDRYRTLFKLVSKK